ncbi:hypothetical protein BG004_002252 [Podila humilis]|nr:hypothetical protein BG004_002252 [Podila humilis]
MVPLRPFDTLPLEVKDCIFSYLSQTTLRNGPSLVCKQWHSIITTRRHLRSVARWKTINSRSNNSNNRNSSINSQSVNQAVATHKVAQDLILQRLGSGLISVLECDFFFDPSLERQPVWEMKEQSDYAWECFVETLTRPIMREVDEMPSDPNNMMMVTEEDDDSGGGGSGEDSFKDKPANSYQPCLLHHIRELVLRGYVDLSRHFTPFLPHLGSLKVLEIETLWTMGDLSINPFDILYACPELRRLRVSGPLNRFVKLVQDKNKGQSFLRGGTLDNNNHYNNIGQPTTNFGSPQRHGLIELSVGRVHVHVSTLKELVSMCPDLQIFRMHDIRPTGMNELVDELSKEVITYIQRDVKQVIDMAQFLCSKLRYIDVMIGNGVWSDEQTLAALEMPFGPEGFGNNNNNSNNNGQCSGSVKGIRGGLTFVSTSSIHQLSLNYAAEENKSLRHSWIFSNLTLLHLKGMTRSDRWRQLDHRVLSQCPKLEHLSIDRGLFLYVGDVMDMDAYEFPSGATPGSVEAISTDEDRANVVRERRLQMLGGYLSQAQWTLWEFLGCPSWVRTRMIAKEPNLVAAGVANLFTIDHGGGVGQLAALTTSIESMSLLTPRRTILTTTTWVCRALRTLSIRLDPGFYELALFGSFLCETCPGLERLLIRYSTLRMGQLVTFDRPGNGLEQQQQQQQHLQQQQQAQGRYLNELLPFRGLRKLRSFRIVVDMLQGWLMARDFEFLASPTKKPYRVSATSNGSDIRMFEEEEEAGEWRKDQPFHETSSRQQQQYQESIDNDKEEIFWPKLEEFEIEVSRARRDERGRPSFYFLPGMAASTTAILALLFPPHLVYSDSPETRRHLNCQEFLFGSSEFLQDVQSFRTGVAFQFLRTYWDGGTV